MYSSKQLKRYNYERKNSRRKKTLLHIKAQEFKDNDTLEKYYELAEATVYAYQHGSRRVLSSAYDVRMMDGSWQESIKSIMSNKDFIVILVDRMLHRDPVALSMYEMLYENDKSLILEDDELLDTEGGIFYEYINRGGNYYTKTEMNAERWLMSPVGESYLNSLED